MSGTPRHTEVTVLLDAAVRGERWASDELLPVVYDELRRVAASMLSRERAGLTLQPTALVHEAYLRLIGTADVTWQNRGHFFGAAALAMRRILIDRARTLKAKRERERVDADPDMVVSAESFGPTQDSEDLLILDECLNALKARDERQHDVVMLRYFAGLTIEQTAAALNLSQATVKNEWTYARAWLLHQIERKRG